MTTCHLHAHIRDRHRSLPRCADSLPRQFPIPPVPSRAEPAIERTPTTAAEARACETAARPLSRRSGSNRPSPSHARSRSGIGSALMVANMAGNIQVSAGSADQIEVQALKHAWGPTAEQAKQQLGNTIIEAYAAGNRVEVRVEQAEAEGTDAACDVEFDVKVPADASVELRTVSGDHARHERQGGDPAARRQRQSGARRHAAPRDAEIGLRRYHADQRRRRHCSCRSRPSAAICWRRRSTPGCSISTRSVAIVRISGWSGERAHIRTLSGDLDLQASLTKGGRYEIESHSGDVRLSLPEQPGFELEAQTFSGRMRIDFPIRSEGPIRDADRGPRAVRGTYGDGSSSLRVQTFSGNLTIVPRMNSPVASTAVSCTDRSAPSSRTARDAGACPAGSSRPCRAPASGRPSPRAPLP